MQRYWFPRLIFLSLAIANSALAEPPTDKPKLPPGRDPGGALIGLITTGIDPSHAHIARCLARDGEGELIGWDMIDRNRQPFRRAKPDQPNDDAMLGDLPCGHVRIAPVRVDPTDPVSLGKAVAFLSTTPALMLVVAPSSRPIAWGPFREAARTLWGTRLIFIPDDPRLPSKTPEPNIIQLPDDLIMGEAVRVLVCANGLPATNSGCR